MPSLKLAALAAALSLSAPALANHHMQSSDHSSATVVELAIGSNQHETLVAALQAANLVDTLASAGPFTVFAPTDQAFSRLPAGTVDTLLRPENRATLQSVLTYHVVPGNISSTQLIGLIEANGGSAQVETVQGGMLTATISDGSVVITDAGGRQATVVAADLGASNGVIHVTNEVFLPN